MCENVKVLYLSQGGTYIKTVTVSHFSNTHLRESRFLQWMGRTTCWSNIFSSTMAK